MYVLFFWNKHQTAQKVLVQVKLDCEVKFYLEVKSHLDVVLLLETPLLVTMKFGCKTPLYFAVE